MTCNEDEEIRSKYIKKSTKNTEGIHGFTKENQWWKKLMFQKSSQREVYELGKGPKHKMHSKDGPEYLTTLAHLHNYEKISYFFLLMGGKAIKLYL